MTDDSSSEVVTSGSDPAPPVAPKSEGVPQGTGFIHLSDPNEMRVILLWEVDLADGWEATFSRWAPRPPNFRAKDRHGKTQRAFRGWRAGYFHPEVADRLLGQGGQGRSGSKESAGAPEHVRAADRRRSLCLPQLIDHTHRDTTALRIGVLEALRVSDGDGPCKAILVVHAVAPDSNYEHLHFSVAHRASLPGIGATIEALLSDPDVCGPGKVALASERGENERWISAPLFTVTWVPLGLSRAWVPLPQETADRLCERIGLPVSTDVVKDIREVTDHVGGAGGRLPAPVLAASGWQWGSMPSPTGNELGEDRYEAALANTHALSQSWAVSLWETGAAYMPRQDDAFLREGMLKMCSTELDVYLLVALDRLRVRSLSKNLARVAQELRMAITSGEALATSEQESGESRLVSGMYEHLISKAIALDADAVAFLASEWWIDITDRRQADTILAWMQDVGRLDDAVAQVVEQSRLLRESVQTLIEREEHILDQQRQDSTRVMEWALAVLAFVGIPLTVLLEIWVNWSTESIASRSVQWWLWLGGVQTGAGVIGWLLARLFRIKLWPLPGRKPGSRGNQPRQKNWGELPEGRCSTRGPNGLFLPGAGVGRSADDEGRV